MNFNLMLSCISVLDLSGTESCRSHWSLCVSECERTMCVRKCKENSIILTPCTPGFILLEMSVGQPYVTCWDVSVVRGKGPTLTDNHDAERCYHFCLSFHLPKGSEEKTEAQRVQVFYSLGQS